MAAATDAYRGSGSFNSQLLLSAQQRPTTTSAATTILTHARQSTTSHASSGPPKRRHVQRPHTPCDVFANVHTLMGRLRLAIHLHPPFLPRHRISALPRPSYQAYDAHLAPHTLTCTRLTFTLQRFLSAAFAPACRPSKQTP